MIDAGLAVHLQDHNGLPFVKTFVYKDVLAVVDYISRYSEFPLNDLIKHYSTFLLVSRKTLPPCMLLLTYQI